ncbi:MAG: hypothetical protein K2Q06_08500, partial [Parvularculaceae bacterium]|nr:hypothetical protein [Parvularculaceae bacterium]
MAPEIVAFFDEPTFTVSYVVADPATGRAAIIDPVLDFDPASGRTSRASAEKIIAHVRGRGLAVDWIGGEGILYMLPFWLWFISIVY